MKKTYLKQITMIAIAISIISIPSVKVQAQWSKDSESKWTWIENESKSIGWKKIDDKWYNFNENGIMNTGWIKDNNNWYYLLENGVMNIGWLKDNNEKWYNFSGSGCMNIGWIQYNDDYYYLKPNGEMATGSINIDGKTYEFLEQGKLSQEETEATEESNVIAYVVTDSNPLNVRNEASTSSEIIGTLPKGSKINVIGKSINGFYKINANGLNGWASSDWISFTEPNSIIEPSIEQNESNSSLSIRTSAPDINDRHYYSNENVFYSAKFSPPFFNNGKPIIGNCTWYSWGRAWEITGKAPNDAGFIGNAYEWWEANKKSGKYKFGDTCRVGALAVWKSSLPNSGGFGHVAVVEKIQDGKIYISESAWHGVLFKYREIYNTEHLYGYIYLDEPNY